VAGERPLVVSCSFGGNSGGHDGALIEERGLASRFSPETRGRALCIAGGNEGEDPFHAGFRVTGGGAEPAIHATRAKGWDGPWLLDVWIDANRAGDFDVYYAQGQLDVLGFNELYHPLQRQVHLEILVEGDGGPIAVASKSGRRYGADAYVRFGPMAGRFEGEAADHELSIGSPGNSTTAITVGSYDWTDRFDFKEGNDVANVRDRGQWRPMELGELSSYSSAGYQRMGGAVKPDLTAPGQYHTAPLSGDAQVDPTFVDSTGRYRIFNGTSAATPYAAGVIALLLERRPGLTAGEVQKALHDAASEDAKTGRTPNFRWGHGKLDKKAVERLLAR
jgi:subtilisin family serine protease